MRERACSMSWNVITRVQYTVASAAAMFLGKKQTTAGKPQSSLTSHFEPSSTLLPLLIAEPQPRFQGASSMPLNQVARTRKRLSFFEIKNMPAINSLWNLTPSLTPLSR